jgi:hypothetical protein
MTVMTMFYAHFMLLIISFIRQHKKNSHLCQEKIWILSLQEHFFHHRATETQRKQIVGNRFICSEIDDKCGTDKSVPYYTEIGTK